MRYGYVLFIEGTQATGENNPLQENERPVVYTPKELQKKPLLKGLFDGNALPCVLELYNTPGQAQLSSKN
jgi:hypothetical protein